MNESTLTNLAVPVARALLEISAVGFSPAQPITFKSGILSPVYVDNRRLIYHPAAWEVIITAFQSVMQAASLTFDIIAGIETAGIPHSSVLAYTSRTPSVFVRKQAKEHGTKSRIEGGDVNGQRVVLVEDVITTGGSSLSGVEALRLDGAIVTDCCAIVSYALPESEQAFSMAEVTLHTLTTFPVIIEQARAMEIFSSEEYAIIVDWLRSPRNWSERQQHA